MTAQTAISADRRTRTRGLSYWLLLLSILVHGLIPAGSPLEASRGSAFSAWTADVSTAPRPQVLGLKQAQLSSSDDRGGRGDDPADTPHAILPPSLPRLQPPAGASETERPAAVGAGAAGAASFDARAPPAL